MKLVFYILLAASMVFSESYKCENITECVQEFDNKVFNNDLDVSTFLYHLKVMSAINGMGPSSSDPDPKCDGSGEPVLEVELQVRTWRGWSSPKKLKLMGTSSAIFGCNGERKVCFDEVKIQIDSGLPWYVSKAKVNRAMQEIIDDIVEKEPCLPCDSCL